MWLKLWNGAHTDPIFPAVADLSGSSPAVAAQTYFALLEYANERDDRGSVAGYERLLPVIASFNRVPLDEVKRIVAVFIQFGKIVGDRIAAWAKRQELPTSAATGARSETSAARRSRRFREVHGRDRRQGELLMELPGGLSQSVARGVASVAQGVARDTEKEKERDSRLKESAKGDQVRSAPFEGRSADDLLHVDTCVEQVRQTCRMPRRDTFDTTFPLDRCASMRGGKPSAEQIREALRAKHMRYLQATGRPGELSAYLATQMGDPEEARQVFDLVDKRMRLEGWDDKRETEAA
jgi:hypothetical protein